MLRLAVDIDMQDWEVHAICLSFWRRLANSYISNFHYFYFSFFILLVHDFSNRKIIEKWSKISDNSPRWPTIEILDVFMICYMMMSSRLKPYVYVLFLDQRIPCTSLYINKILIHPNLKEKKKKIGCITQWFEKLWITIFDAQQPYKYRRSKNKGG